MARPIIRPASARKPIGLALQGGGSWGAYTWGVLDALLASRSITLDVGGVYVDSRKPKLRMPASNPRLNVDITALSHAA